MPIAFILMITIPSPRRPCTRRLYPLTFLLCVVWIAISAYMVSWMLAVVGKKKNNFITIQQTANSREHLLFNFRKCFYSSCFFLKSPSLFSPTFPGFPWIPGNPVLTPNRPAMSFVNRKIYFRGSFQFIIFTI